MWNTLSGVEVDTALSRQGEKAMNRAQINRFAPVSAEDRDEPSFRRSVLATSFSCGDDFIDKPFTMLLE